jgi:hypothetical protein
MVALVLRLNLSGRGAVSHLLCHREFATPGACVITVAYSFPYATTITYEYGVNSKPMFRGTESFSLAVEVILLLSRASHTLSEEEAKSKGGEYKL